LAAVAIGRPLTTWKRPNSQQTRHSAAGHQKAPGGNVADAGWQSGRTGDGRTDGRTDGGVAVRAFVLVLFLL